MIRRAAAFVVMFVLSHSVAALAADDRTPTPAGTLSAAVERAAKDAATPDLASWAVLEAPKRPGTLTAMYGTYGALQVLDIVSTRRALAAGAEERNPLMRGGQMKTMIAVKAAAGVSTIFFAERMWKKNKVGAIVVMAALNGASAAIVAHNQRNARR